MTETAMQPTHQVIDLVYTEAEGNVEFEGTEPECYDYIMQQGSMAFTYKVVPIVKPDETITERAMNDDYTD